MKNSKEIIINYHTVKRQYKGQILKNPRVKQTVLKLIIKVKSIRNKQKKIKK